MIDEIKGLICLPWFVVCRIFNLGKFENFVTEYPDPYDELYGIEPWQSGGIAEHADCERKKCPYKCRLRNY